MPFIFVLPDAECRGGGKKRERENCMIKGSMSDRPASSILHPFANKAQSINQSVCVSSSLLPPPPPTPPLFCLRLYFYSPTTRKKKS